MIVPSTSSSNTAAAVRLFSPKSLMGTSHHDRSPTSKILHLASSLCYRVQSAWKVVLERPEREMALVGHSAFFMHMFTPLFQELHGLVRYEDEMVQWVRDLIIASCELFWWIILEYRYKGYAPHDSVSLWILQIWAIQMSTGQYILTRTSNIARDFLFNLLSIAMQEWALHRITFLQKLSHEMSAHYAHPSKMP